MDFTSISDFGAASGPFVGAFYKIKDQIKDLGEGRHPFIIIVFKGASPSLFLFFRADEDGRRDDPDRRRRGRSRLS